MHINNKKKRKKEKRKKKAFCLTVYVLDLAVILVQILFFTSCATADQLTGWLALAQLSNTREVITNSEGLKSDVLLH